MKIGAIGGCINKQKGLQLTELYHHVLTAEMQNNNSGEAIQFLSCSYLSYLQLPQKAISFLSKNKPDIFCLFIRPFPMMPLQKPLIKFDRSGKKTGYSLHPALFNRKQTWKYSFTEHLSSGNFVFNQKPRLGFRDLNLIGGIALGLHRWAMQYIVQQLDSIIRYCADNNIQLIILGPPKNPESIIADKTCFWANQYLQKKYSNSAVKYIDLFQLSTGYFEPDMIHFNATGHAAIARLLLSELKFRKNTILADAAV